MAGYHGHGLGLCGWRDLLGLGHGHGVHGMPRSCLHVENEMRHMAWIPWPRPLGFSHGTDVICKIYLGFRAWPLQKDQLEPG